MTLCILAFDLATRTGCAVGAASETPITWAVDLSRGNASQFTRYGRALKMTRICIQKYQPDLVVIEAAIGGKNSSQFLVGLMACVTGQATEMGVTVEQHNIGSIRRHFLGKHLTARDFPAMSAHAAKRAIKGAVLNRCRALGWPVAGPDEADSAALWDYACALRCHAHAVQTAGELWT